MGAVHSSDNDRYAWVPPPKKPSLPFHTNDRVLVSLPPDRFQSCYTIPHWRMPQMTILRRIARKTVSGLLTHLSLVHLPTFHMRDIPVGLAFAISVVGSPKRSSIAREHLFAQVSGPGKNIDQAERHMWFTGNGVLRPDPPGCEPSCLIEEISETPEERDFEERKKVGLMSCLSCKAPPDRHRAPQMVSVEKSSMIAQILSNQKDKTLQPHQCGLLQALVLFASALVSHSVRWLSSRAQPLQRPAATSTANFQSTRGIRSSPRHHQCG